MVKKNKAGDKGFTLFDQHNTKAILFDHKLKDQLLKNGYEDAQLLEVVLSSPDEVFMNSSSNTIYIKYMANNPVILETQSDKDHIVCINIKNIGINSAEGLRKGTLIYLK